MKQEKNKVDPPKSKDSDSATSHSEAPHQSEELLVDLGYAEEQQDAHEQDNPLIDTIQTLSLDQMVIEDDAPLVDTLTESATQSEPSEAREEAILTLSEVVPMVEEVTAESKPAVPTEEPTASEPPHYSESSPLAQSIPLTPLTPANTGKLQSELLNVPGAPEQPKLSPSKRENPFLPQHILDKLNKGRQELEADFVQSSAALDVSTAILRTHARAERLGRPQINNPFSAKDREALEKQKLVDQLVDEYLPLVAAELRRRLHQMLDK